MAQYNENRDTYETISAGLERLRTLFVNADRFTQKVMLFDASSYAVMSVQTPIENLRDAFRAYTRADDWNEVEDALRIVNYRNNKFRYMRHNFDAIFGETGNRIIGKLESGNIWNAVQIMADELRGVSYVKAPFVGAMLGFKGLMCIDTNVEQQVDGVKSKDYKSMTEYQAAVERVKDQYAGLNDELSVFMVQWVIFDANRDDGVARHEEWFNHMLPGTPFAQQVALDEY